MSRVCLRSSRPIVVPPSPSSSLSSTYIIQHALFRRDGSWYTPPLVLMRPLLFLRAHPYNRVLSSPVSI